MILRVPKWFVLVAVLFGCSLLQAQTDQQPEALKAAVKKLQVHEVPWRSIPWNESLISGLNQSKSDKKPVLLWVFIDRPFDDARC